MRYSPDAIGSVYWLYKQKLGNLPPLESDEDEVKEGKKIKILTPNKLLTRLPILQAQIKAGNNLYKLQNKTRKIAYLRYQINFTL